MTTHSDATAPSPSEVEALLPCAPPEGTLSGTWHWLARAHGPNRIAEWAPYDAGWMLPGIQELIDRSELSRTGYRYLGPVAPYAASPAGEVMETYQARVDDWMRACFPPDVRIDSTERSDRFLEEAIELVQSVGETAERCHALVDYVFSRPAGDPKQEVGGVMVCLAALCTAAELDMTDAGEVELARVWTKIDVIQAKHAAKPKGSALPGYATFSRAQPSGEDRSVSDVGAAKATRVTDEMVEVAARTFQDALWDGEPSPLRTALEAALALTPPAEPAGWQVSSPWDGMPVDPHKSGWHWLRTKHGGIPMPWEWSNEGGGEEEFCWQTDDDGDPDNMAIQFDYVCPLPTPPASEAAR